MLSKNQAKFLKSLSLKKQRQKYESFLAEGDKVVNEILASDLIIDRLYALPEWIAKNSYQTSSKVPNPEAINELEMKKISLLKSPSPVLAVVRQKTSQNPPVLALDRPVLVLDEIKDPGNLGTIIRTADWFGLQQIVCSRECVDCYNPKVVQSTMGSIARMEIIYADLLDFFEQHPTVPKYGALLKGEPIKKLKFPTACFVVIGNESRGIKLDLQAKLDTAFSIQGSGKAESLNAAIATAITLHTILEL